MNSNLRASNQRSAAWIEEHALVGVRFVRGGRVVSHLELGVRERVCAERLREAVLARLFQLRVQLVRWERALEDSIELHRLALVEFDGASLEPSRRGSIAAELRALVQELMSAGSPSRVVSVSRPVATVASIRAGVVAA
ncbi:MAG: hypothetical protein R3B07_06050 [Polyangiaceae bacterium]